MGRGANNEKLELQCKFGALVCEVTRDDDDYREFSIDLVRPDGKAYQVCVVGTNEYDEVQGDELVHVNLWDGKDDDSCGCHHMDPNGDGYYTDDYRLFNNIVDRIRQEAATL